MASPSLTELFDFTPYPRPKPGRELEAEIATNGAAGLSSLISAIEFLCWEGGSSDPAASPAERLRQQQTARFEAGYAARHDDDLIVLVQGRCPALIDVLNMMATAWPGPDEAVADELVRPTSGARATDAAVEAFASVITALRARLTEKPLPSPRLPGASRVLHLVRSLNVDDAERVVANRAALDEAAAADPASENIRKKLGANANLDDELLQAANAAAHIVLDLAAAYFNRREADPEMAAVLKRLTAAVFKVATPTIKEANARDMAELQTTVESAYARVRTAPEDLREVLRDEARRFFHNPFIFSVLDQFVIPVDDSDASASRDDGEPVSITALGGPKRAASIMVARVLGDAAPARTTLEDYSARWHGATRMTAFGVKPDARVRLRYVCRLVTTNDEDAERLFYAAVQASQDAGWSFFWREASPVRWG
jgi:hypothetical protein